MRISYRKVEVKLSKCIFIASHVAGIRLHFLYRTLGPQEIKSMSVGAIRFYLPSYYK